MKHIRIERCSRRWSMACAAMSCVLLCACQSTAPASAAKHQTYSATMCSGYFAPGTASYEQCLGEVDGAIDRQSMSRSRINCTPMGERMECL